MLIIRISEGNASAGRKGPVTTVVPDRIPVEVFPSRKAVRPVGYNVNANAFPTR